MRGVTIPTYGPADLLLFGNRIYRVDGFSCLAENGKVIS